MADFHVIRLNTDGSLLVLDLPTYHVPIELLDSVGSSVQIMPCVLNPIMNVAFDPRARINRKPFNVLATGILFDPNIIVLGPALIGSNWFRGMEGFEHHSLFGFSDEGLDLVLSFFQSAGVIGHDMPRHRSAEQFIAGRRMRSPEEMKVNQNDSSASN